MTTDTRSTVLLKHHLKALRLPTVLAECEKVARRCAADNVDHLVFLLQVVELELIERERKAAERRLKAARFPAPKTLDEFDFAARPSVNKPLLLDLARGDYLGKRENVLFVGPSGTGKTHLATALGMAACAQGKRVRFWRVAGSPLTELTNDLGRILLCHDGADLTDAQLLTRFIERGDEAAFEALVRRHASMVLGVCRRVLRNSHDAEDPFQVVFLVLAQKAASVRPREAVASWLYGVARKAALKARAAAARRREHQVHELPEPPPREVPGEDLRPLLESELTRLPDKYRAVVVLCDLEGRSRRDAARLLGWPEGTVCGRLARARALLARRLGRSVAVVGASLTTLAAADPAPAGVPSTLLTVVLRSASPHTASAAAVSPHILTLVRGVRRALWLGKLKVVVAVLAVAGLLGTSLGLAGRTLRFGPGAVPGSDEAVASAAQAHAGPAGIRTDPQQLQGVWQLVWLVNDGNQVPDNEVRDVRLELTDTVFRSDCAGPLFRESTYTTDPTRDPKWLDLTSRGNIEPHVCQAIYRFEGDQLILCYPRSGVERPARFESTPGSGWTLTRWLRVGN
jgi:RNA polymerase sigma factor (sigma-70 family)